MEECFVIHMTLNGMYTYNDLKQMDWLTYEKIVQKVKQIKNKD
jgi:hypothetical protein